MNITARIGGFVMMMLHRIERYLRMTDMPPTKFGRLAINDPRLVRDLRNGREIGRQVSARIEAFLAASAQR